jgi:hypothetical protein
MRIAIVGPGISPIPPNGWGGVESLIWDQNKAYINMGHEVKIINTQDRYSILNEINSFGPDFVHIHYDTYIDIYNYIEYPKAITSHYPYLDQTEKMRQDGYIESLFYQFGAVQPNSFCLSESIIKNLNEGVGIPKNKLFLTPNGIENNILGNLESLSFPIKAFMLLKLIKEKDSMLFNQ